MPVRVKDKRILADAKDESIIVGKVHRFVQKRGIDPDDLDRRDDIIHPSELAKDDFCPRAVYYRIAGYPQIEALPQNSFVLRQILNEGSDIHRKWQRDLWDMGELTGLYGCLICRELKRTIDPERRWKWWSTAPTQCLYCKAPRDFLIYLEVPIRDEEHLIYGHSDGRVGPRLLEIKSVAKGTVRVEAPQLYNRYTKTVICDGEEIQWLDLEGLWRAIKRPFKSHIRQGQLYLHATGLDQMVFIYECKWNQQHKEFVVRYNPSVLEPLFDMALDVKWALEKEKPPFCPHGGCSYCRSYEGEEGAPSRGRVADDGGGDHGSEGGTGEERLPPSWSTVGGGAEPPEETDGPDRRRPDGTDGVIHTLDGSHRRIVRSPRGRRAVRRLSV